MLSISDQRHRLLVARAELDKLAADLDLAERREQVAMMTDVAEQAAALRALRALYPQQLVLTLAALQSAATARLADHLHDSCDDALADLERAFPRLVEIHLADLPPRCKVSVLAIDPPQVDIVEDEIDVPGEPELIVDAAGKILATLPRTKKQRVRKRIVRDRGPRLIRAEMIDVNPQHRAVIDLLALRASGACRFEIALDEYGNRTVAKLERPCIPDGTVWRCDVLALWQEIDPTLSDRITTTPLDAAANRNHEAAERTRNFTSPHPPLVRRVRRSPTSGRTP